MDYLVELYVELYKRGQGHLIPEEYRDHREIIKAVNLESAADDLLSFTKYTMEGFSPSWFHKTYYNILDKFAKKAIKRLIITVPPQHGKSEGSTRRLPAYLFGLDPTVKIAIASYNAEFASDFNRDIQNIIDSEEYHDIFPDTVLNSSNVVTIAGTALRNSKVFEIVKHRGRLKALGVGGGLTGQKVDVMIMDDLYKDMADACSPIISDGVWKWYNSVVRKRMHNDSQELIVFTRWHEEDLIGRLEDSGQVITFEDGMNLDEVLASMDEDQFLKINFPALKIGAPNSLDPREDDEALWPERHNEKKLKAERALDPVGFDAMNQGDPESKDGLLYNEFKTYKELPEIIEIKSYTDTADTGTNYLANIYYARVRSSNLIYIIDVYYTNEGMDKTQPEVEKRIVQNNCRKNKFESNNGGKGFAKAVDKELEKQYGYKYDVEWFTQTGNKESRIISNSNSVNKTVVMPQDWHILWPKFYSHVKKFKKLFKANKFDDAPDVLTGIYEEEFENQANEIVW